MLKFVTISFLMSWIFVIRVEIMFLISHKDLHLPELKIKNSNGLISR